MSKVKFVLLFARVRENSIAEYLYLPGMFAHCLAPSFLLPVYSPVPSTFESIRLLFNFHLENIFACRMNCPFYSIKSVCVGDEYKFSVFIPRNRYILARTVSSVRTCVRVPLSMCWKIARRINEQKRDIDSLLVEYWFGRAALYLLHTMHPIFQTHLIRILVCMNGWVYVGFVCAQNTAFKSLKMTFIDIDAIFNALSPIRYTPTTRILFLVESHEHKNKNKIQMAYRNSFCVCVGFCCMQNC